MTRRNFGFGIAAVAAAISMPVGNAPAASLPPEAVAVVSTKDIEPQCEKGKDWCECDENISKLPIIPPQGMSLVSVGGCRRYPRNDLYGFFTFKGDVTIRGVVVRESTAIFSDYVSFQATNPNGYSQFASVIYSLTFMNNSPFVDNLSAAIGKFKLPALTNESTCWTADAVIRVRELYVLALDEDGAGNYPRDFDVLEVGAYKQCKAMQ